MKQLLAWCQLLRAGNVLTAASNVIAGFLVVQGGWQPLGPLAALVATSALLYLTGMVLNDAMDAPLDAVERPERPIPSGRVSRGAALTVGWTLLVLGAACGWYASRLVINPRAGIVSVLLAMCIVLYDMGLKSTPLGPLAMGLCRFLNVLLGASVAEHFGTSAWVLAGLVGVYTMGITYYARAENVDRETLSHIVGEALIGVAIVGLLLFPMSLGEEGQFRVGAMGWFVAWLVVFLATGGSAWLTNREITSASFRRRVTALLCGFILIDACAAAAVAGWKAGLIVLALWIPTRFASRFVPMT